MKLLLFITIGFIGVSCKHKTPFNDLSEVSYVRDISPIISSNCAFSGCHGATEFEGFNLTTYTGLISGGVEAGLPEKSTVYTTLKSLNDGSIMPRKPYTALKEAQIQLIYVWIGQGAKNN